MRSDCHFCFCFCAFISLSAENSSSCLKRRGICSIKAISSSSIVVLEGLFDSFLIGRLLACACVLRELSLMPGRGLVEAVDKNPRLTLN
ncbi:hypothetical protein BC832DRAFT_470943 [Gaertneriomyces semiglobifer]|nr:hypothetical protein BC832DRAFT_470943 [Gaertneriomyces semiglobifer]